MPISPALLQALKQRQAELQGGQGIQPSVPATPAPQNAGVPQPPQSPANAPMTPPAPSQGQPQASNQVAQAGQVAQSPQFDDDVKQAAKVLIMKLMKHV